MIYFGTDMLDRLEGVVIREKVRLSQILLGWEQPNVYQIEERNPYATSSGMSRGAPLLLAQERSDVCSRQCCPSGVRGWEMEVMIPPSGFR